MGQCVSESTLTRPRRVHKRMMPMPSSTLHSMFSFRTCSTTVLASLFYLAIFTSLYVTQNGPSVPSRQKQHALGLNVEQAYRDLHVVSVPSYTVRNAHILPVDRRKSSSLQFASKRYHPRFLVGTSTSHSKRLRFHPRRGRRPYERRIRGFGVRKQLNSRVFPREQHSREG